MHKISNPFTINYYMTHLTGQCLCGQISYTLTSAPLLTRACWCTVCQTFASGNATINAVFLKNTCQINGQTATYTSIADSGNHMHRKFCPTCGTHLFSEAEERPHLIVIRTGTLNHQNTLKPDGYIWTSQAPAWALFDPSLPQYPEQPPLSSNLNIDTPKRIS